MSTPSLLDLTQFGFAVSLLEQTLTLRRMNRQCNQSVGKPVVVVIAVARRVLLDSWAGEIQQRGSDCVGGSNYQMMHRQ